MRILGYFSEFLASPAITCMHLKKARPAPPNRLLFFGRFREENDNHELERRLRRTYKAAGSAGLRHARVVATGGRGEQLRKRSATRRPPPAATATGVTITTSPPSSATTTSPRRRIYYRDRHSRPSLPFATLRYPSLPCRSYLVNGIHDHLGSILPLPSLVSW